MSRPSVRRTATLLHRWVGLTVGLLLAVVGLSGSALVFREEIDLALNPELLRVEVRDARQPLAAVVGAARAAYPASSRAVDSMLLANEAIQLVPSACPNRYPGGRWSRSKALMLSIPRKPPWKMFLPKASLRLTHQVKLSSIF